MGAMEMELDSLQVRGVTEQDVAAVAELTGQLGYPAGVEAIREQVVALASRETDRAVFVACVGGQVVGWIDVALSFHLQSPAYALIGGLVVKEGLRGLGIGKRLCDEAEAWSRARSVFKMRVTSRSTRTDAHRFYLRDGYSEVKTSRVFEKTLT
jgi:GNAT superfamily N-acetyltransferase